MVVFAASAGDGLELALDELWRAAHDQRPRFSPAKLREQAALACRFGKPMSAQGIAWSAARVLVRQARPWTSPTLKSSAKTLEQAKAGTARLAHTQRFVSAILLILLLLDSQH